MKTTQLTSNIQESKHFSIKMGIIDSWKVFAMNTKDFLRYLWFYFLIAGIGFAFLSNVTNQFNTNYLIPHRLLLQSGIEKEIADMLYAPSASAVVLLVVAIITFLLSNALMYGAVFSQIRFHRATTSLPLGKPFFFWNEIRKDGMKALGFDIILSVIIGVHVALFAFLAIYFQKTWIAMFSLPFLIYWIVIGTCGRLLFVVEKENFKSAVKEAFKIGHHHFGGYLIIILLTSIPMGAITYSALLPNTIYSAAHGANAASMLAGYPDGIPTYVSIMFFAINILGYFIFSVGYALQQWPLASYTKNVK